MAARKVKQKAKKHINATLSDTSVEEYNESAHTSELSTLISSFKRQIQEQKKCLKSLTDSYNFMSNCFDTLKGEIKKIQEDNKKLNKDVKQLQNNELDMRKRIQQLEHTVAKTKQDSNDNNMIITNLPEINKDIDLKTIVAKIASQVQYNLEQDEIVDVYQTHNQKSKTHPIIVKLKTNQLKLKCMAYRKSNKNIDIKQISSALNNNGKNINFYHMLEREYAELLMKAKQIARKKKNYKYVWYAGATILVRKADQTMVLKIKNETDLKLIK